MPLPPLESSDPGQPTQGRSPLPLWLMWVVWLPFFAPPIWNALHAPLAPARLAAILIGIALFAGIYLSLTWRNARRLVGHAVPTSTLAESGGRDWMPVAGLAVLSLALALLGNANGNTVFEPFVYTSAYAAGRLPAARAAAAVASLDLLVALTGRLGGVTSSALVAALVFVSAVGAVVILLVRAITSEWELRAAREEIARLAVTAERLRIARDLHDLLGHNLSLITLKSELAGRLVATAPERAAREIGDVERVARGTLQQVRQALAGYGQPGLEAELSGAREMLAAAGIDYRFDGDGRVADTLPAPVEALLAWTVREGVTNVIRHSRAPRCTIRLTRDPQSAQLEVVDDGAGAPPLAGQAGSGLRGLAERAAALGAASQAGPMAGGGFRLAVSVPLSPVREQP